MTSEVNYDSWFVDISIPKPLRNHKILRLGARAEISIFQASYLHGVEILTHPSVLHDLVRLLGRRFQNLKFWVCGSVLDFNGDCRRSS
jgi:hypothetical protein